MGEIPYREIVEGAKFLMKLPLEQQLRLIELIMRSVPANVEETVKKIMSELGPADLENVREVLAFTLAIIKGLARKDPSEVVRDLEKMGFSEKSAKAIVDKVVEELPSAEKDAELLKELGDEELSKLLASWVKFFTGDYEDFGEWGEEAGLPDHYLLAASRFLESALKSVLSGEISLRRLRRALIEEYGFKPAQAARMVRTFEENMEELFRVMVFRYLKRLLDAIE